MNILKNHFSYQVRFRFVRGNYHSKKSLCMFEIGTHYLPLHRSGYELVAQRAL